MSLTQSLSFSPSIKFSLEKYSQKTNVVSWFGNYENIRLRSRNSVGKLGVNYNGYTYFTSPHHPLESELPSEVESSGIGIVEFFEGKNIFITGATGLVGKAFVEKLMRSTSVGKIYLLVKANDKETAVDRLTKEIINSELFECIREKHGISYEKFVREKLIPVVGNICEPNLGMDTCSAHEIMEEVDVIIESAASTTLNDRYDYLLDINVNAPQRLMRFAKTCKNLKLFVHISTAYVNGRKEGIIFEKPLIMGENGRKEAMSSTSSFPRLDLADEIKLAMRTMMASTDSDATKGLKRLGLERAGLYGWYNPYHMTKAMGEMVLNEMRGEVPVLIIRPSVIESTFNEPLPGWIQGNRMFDPVIISYGKGLLPAYLADPDGHMDIVPVDMVVNTTIAAIAKHGIMDKPDLNAYHVATGFVNPLRFSEFFDYIYEHFSLSPLSSDLGSIKKMKLFSEFNDFSKYIKDEISELNRMRSGAVGINGNTTLQKLRKQYKANIVYAEQLCKMYEFVGFFKARFHTGNTQKLLEEMSKEEQVHFEIDARKIDWRKYFVEVHIPGLRKHVLNGARVSV